MSNQTTTARAGLFARGEEQEPVPLAGVTVDAELHGFYAKVVVAHRYVNTESTPIEAVYVFPLDEGAAVCGFEAIVDGTLVVGEVHEREKAFEIYDDAMEAGHGAFLLDEERADVFQASIGNLLPGKEVLIRLTYVTELTVDEGRLRFVIPTTLSPRYAPAEDHVGTGRPDAVALNPPVSWSVPYGLNLSIRILMPGGVSTIESPSHPIALQMRDGDALVSLAQKDAALDRDFVLSIEAQGLASPQALVEHNDDDGTEAVGVAFAPAFETKSAPAELIFLVDRSGSMQGTSIVEVRNALQLCLRSMTPGCHFNIVGFGSTYQALFPESRAYDQGALEVAARHVEDLEANLGGTEILPALRFVLQSERSGKLPRQVVILTDGEVTNTDAVIALAAEHANDARIFAFGIGAGASHHLVRGLARAGGGAAEFIHPGERIEPKVLRQFARLLSPALNDVRVEWTDQLPPEARSAKVSVKQAPTRVPPVFAGGRLLIYGFVKNHRPSCVRLTATGPSGPLAFEVPISGNAAIPGRTVATLAARSRIRELEEGGEWLAARGSQQKDRKAGSARQEIIALSLRYGLISRETSFVAVERRDAPVPGEVKLRKVPIALTSGWGGLDTPAEASLRRAYKTTAPPILSARLILDESAPALRAQASSMPPSTSARAFKSRVTEYFQENLERAFSRTRAQRAVPSGMQALIRLQAADGSWTLTGDLASILDRKLSELRAAVQGANGSEDEVHRAWATALALAWLREHASDAQDEWCLLAEKAQRWLDRTSAVHPGGSPWPAAAQSFLNY